MTHYSAVELHELLVALEKIVNRGIAQTQTLTVVQRNREIIGKMSEDESGFADSAR